MLDDTHLCNAVKERKLRFFPAYIHITTMAINGIDEFRYGIRDGRLVLYGNLTPLFPQLNNDRTISMSWLEWNPSFSAFHESCLVEQRTRKQGGFLSRPDRVPPPEAYTISLLPWVGFSHFAVHTDYSAPYFFPSIEGGRFRKEGSRIEMPISVSAHHATTDGYHVSLLLDAIQGYMDSPDDILLS